MREQIDPAMIEESAHRLASNAALSLLQLLDFAREMRTRAQSMRPGREVKQAQKRARRESGARQHATNAPACML